jgi:hypothetical protein
LRTRIEDLNLAQNGLGFKTGQFLLNFIVTCCCPENMNKIHLKRVNLGFNLMSDSLVDRIQQALKTLKHIKSSPPEGEHQMSETQQLAQNRKEMLDEYIKSRNPAIQRASTPNTTSKAYISKYKLQEKSPSPK